jgi:hypothetical protein
MPMTTENGHQPEPTLPTAREAAQLLTHIVEARPGKHVKVEAGELPYEIKLLREWQSTRLAWSHHDLLEHPRFRPATQFFLSDVYAPRDFSQRNYDIQKAYDAMRKAVPERVVHTLAETIELHAFTDELDSKLADALFGQLGVGEHITPESYAEAYRICDNYDDRVRQIDMIVKIGQSVDRIVRLPFIGLTLRLAHTPAVLAGWHELQGFLERGYSAFKHMKGAGDFLNILETREKKILDRIYANDPDPFDLKGHS